MVIGLFRDKEHAERAYRSMSERGYDCNSVNLVITDKTCRMHYSAKAAPTELATLAAEGAGVGAGIGGTIGGLAASLAAAASALAIPGLGIVFAGPIAGVVAGIGAGGVTSGLIGALLNSGIPEEHVRQYESGVQNGGILLSVKPRSAADAEHFEREWKTYDADTLRR